MNNLAQTINCNSKQNTQLIIWFLKYNNSIMHKTNYLTQSNTQSITHRRQLIWINNCSLNYKTEFWLLIKYSKVSNKTFKVKLKHLPQLKSKSCRREKCSESSWKSNSVSHAPFCSSAWSPRALATRHALWSTRRVKHLRLEIGECRCLRLGLLVANMSSTRPQSPPNSTYWRKRVRNTKFGFSCSGPRLTKRGV